MAVRRRMRVLIAGGGIGGLTAAHALRHAGLDVAVFERANDLRKIQVGGTIIVWSNAMKALRWIGLDGRVQAAGVPLERDTFHSWRGELLAVWPVAEMGRRLGAPTIGLGRGDLHRTLSAALEDDIVHLDASCTGFTQDGSGVAVQLADGRQECGDVLIGADGIKSAIRAQLMGESQPVYAGYSLWQANVQTDLGTVGVSQMAFGPGARFVLAKLHPDRAHWFAVLGAAEDAEMDKRGLLARYRGWMDPVERVLEATEERAITRLNVTDRPPVSRWGVGRVTLLGDAAHPLRWDIGQGGSQAMEDAVVLARCLRDEDDPVAALRAYEKRRIARTAMLALQARRIGWAASWRGAVACRLRDQTLKMGWGLGLRAMTERYLIGYEA